MGDWKIAYGVLEGKRERQKPVRIPSRRWEYDIKMDLQELGWGHDMAQVRDRWRAFVNAVMNLRVP
jgi:hypothetical protein